MKKTLNDDGVSVDARIDPQAEISQMRQKAFILKKEGEINSLKNFSKAYEKREFPIQQRFPKDNKSLTPLKAPSKQSSNNSKQQKQKVPNVIYIREEAPVIMEEEEEEEELLPLNNAKDIKTGIIRERDSIFHPIKPRCNCCYWTAVIMAFVLLIYFVVNIVYFLNEASENDPSTNKQCHNNSN